MLDLVFLQFSDVNDFPCLVCLVHFLQFDSDFSYDEVMVAVDICASVNSRVHQLGSTLSIDDLFNLFLVSSIWGLPCNVVYVLVLEESSSNDRAVGRAQVCYSISVLVHDTTSFSVHCCPSRVVLSIPILPFRSPKIRSK